ncbi:MAG: hypothetical protein WCA30_19175, partial [Dermatophilaceae bacterium]
GGSDVPTALARWQAGLIVLVTVWALVTVALLAGSFQAGRAGAANTAQLTRINAIESNLFRADAIATNAFLVGGLEPAEQRAAYDAALEEVSGLIIASADAQPADREALAVLNTQVLRYAEQMQQARANNRQGLPVGAQYLREASALLRSDTLPVLDALITANEERATSAFGAHQFILVALPGVIVLLFLGWFNQRLAHVFRRRFNVGLVGAAAVVGLLTIIATAVTWSLANEADRLREGDFATAVETSAAKTAANDAKSNESLRLISRGSGAAFEEAWAEADARVTDLVADDRDLTVAWEAYRNAHLDIVAADEAGDWDGAVQQAVSTDGGSASALFADFDERAEAVVVEASENVRDDLTSGGWRIVATALGTVLAAASAIAALAWGMLARRKEFG